MSAITMDEQLYTVEDLARILKLHKNTIREKIKRGEIVASWTGKEYRIRQRDLDDYLRATQRPRQERE